jgi:hypothetical protein
VTLSPLRFDQLLNDTNVDDQQDEKRDSIDKYHVAVLKHDQVVDFILAKFGQLGLVDGLGVVFVRHEALGLNFEPSRQVVHDTKDE